MPRDGTKNLKPQNQRTKSEQRKIAAMGGAASGVARRKRKALRDELIELLSLVSTDDKEGRSEQAVMLVSMLRRAQTGDVSAATFIRDTIGERPSDKLNINGDLNVSALEKGRERAKQRI